MSGEDIKSRYSLRLSLWADPTCRRAGDTKLADDPLPSLSLRGALMPPSLSPDVADLAPSGPDLTVYDEEHGITYLRLLDADAEGADWREVSRIVLHIDPDREPDRARRAFDNHLTRAKWLSNVGYKDLLRRGWQSERQAN